MGTTPNASRADIIAMLRDGHSNSRIARELHVDKQRVRRIRQELGLPAFVPVEQTRTIEEKWALFARTVDGGHMEWTGTCGTASGTPVLSYKEKVHTAASIAFTIHHGREPHGYVLPECDMQHCVAPDHVEDEQGRLAKRAALRAAAGWRDRAETCSQGHDQSDHGRLYPNGVAYCHACMVERKHEPEHAKTVRAAGREATRETIAALLREGLPNIRVARQVGVAPATVQRIRDDLGLPAARPGRRNTYASLEEAFRANTQRTDDGHLRWTGYTHPKTGSQYVCFRQERLTAAKVAFTLHLGREPEGRVWPGCGMNGCVEGAHLADRLMRQANERADKAFAVIFGGAA
ncbi:hypothetical protein [Streptomyces canus]|uniref:hypothetical protein n=1 Tax=Streptomyces canus TaxID=58343 RepID=UPI0033B06947